MGDLGIDAWKLGVQLIAFLGFIFLLWKFALGPIVNAIDARSAKIEESMSAAEKMQADLKATAARNEAALQEARREGQQIIVNAREASESMLNRAREDAGRQADEYLTRAQASLRSEVDQARLQLRQELAELATTAAGKIVRKELDPATQNQLIEETLAEATTSNGRA
jgi:F-type H+-transporting ATPase subunit b